MGKKNGKSRENGKITKGNIIFQSFILFSFKPYDKVTFTDIEKVTGLSRGAILYHFDSKQEIFNAVVESALLSRTTILDIPIREKNPLQTFIVDFVSSCKDAVKEMSKHGIKNMNLAHYNIESQALYFYDQFDKLSKQMRITELKVWSQVIKKAQDTSEIKKDLNPDLLATLFLNAYLGHAYSAAKEEKGCNTDLLLEELTYLYKIL
jgi:AcrR family transcriptional regulator